MNKSLAFLFVLTCAVALQAAKPDDAHTYIDPEAAAQDPDFTLQGEYAGEGKGLQVVALGAGQFFAVELHGGLPGAGWDSATPTVTRGDRAAMTSRIGSLQRTTRTSPTLGAKPPKDATVLFDGTEASASQWNGGKIEGNLLVEGGSTKATFGAFHLHMEFRLPYKPSRFPSSQDRGNSGLYIFNRYETQILDSFGLHYDKGEDSVWPARFEKDLGKKPESDRKQWCGAFYKFKTPDVGMALPPLTWQTYDIDFTPPTFEATKKTANARITIKHNGVMIHDNVELPGGTGAGGKRPEVARESLYLQGHGNPVRFQNIWIVPKN